MIAKVDHQRGDHVDRPVADPVRRDHRLRRDAEPENSGTKTGARIAHFAITPGMIQVEDEDQR